MKMNKNWFGNRSRKNCDVNFCAQKFEETIAYDMNPGRGWYRVYTFQIEKPIDYESLKVVCCKDEQLALLLVDLKFYQFDSLDEKALLHMTQILEFFQQEKKELILRCVYDTEGKGMETEPFGIHLIQTHMRQLGPIIKQYAKTILTLQGLFIGSWGEMHQSKFLKPEDLKELVLTMQEVTDGTIQLAVRKPQYLRMLSKVCDKLEIGLFNDGIMASESDFGTYGSARKSTESIEDAWCREDEMAFQNKVGQQVLCGGEVVNDNPLNDLETAITDLEKMHVTYLHSIYDMKVLDKWKNTIYQKEGAFKGVDGFAYIGAHLGYRFVIKEVIAEFKKNKMILTLNIKNTGFAKAYENMKVNLLLKDENEMIIRIPITTNVLKWTSKKVIIISVEVELPVIKTAEIHLQILREKDNHPIWLANVGAGETMLLGKLFNTKIAK